MLTYEDCLAFTDLTPEAVDGIAVREGLPAIVALGLARYLSTLTKGARAHTPGRGSRPRSTPSKLERRRDAAQTTVTRARAVAGRASGGISPPGSRSRRSASAASCA